MIYFKNSDIIGLIGLCLVALAGNIYTLATDASCEACIRLDIFLISFSTIALAYLVKSLVNRLKSK